MNLIVFFRRQYAAVHYFCITASALKKRTGFTGILFALYLINRLVLGDIIHTSKYIR